MGVDIAMMSWRHRGMMIGAQPAGPTASHERRGKGRRETNATGVLYKQNIGNPEREVDFCYFCCFRPSMTIAQSVDLISTSRTRVDAPEPNCFPFLKLRHR